jgi:undecaprenyl-diphosphatase
MILVPMAAIGGVNFFDTAILSFINQFAGKSQVFDEFVLTLMRVNLLKGSAFLAVFLWIWFRDPENKTRDRQFVILSLIMSFGAVAIARALALSLPFRERPLRVPDLLFRVPYSADLHGLEGWSSFPSDHAAMFFAWATCLLFISRRLGIWALAYTFVVICMTRVYVGIHYPTDIVAGALIGTALAFGVKAPQARSAVNPLLRWEQLYPSRFYPVFFVVLFEVSDLFGSVRTMGHFGWTVIKSGVAHLVH